MPYRGPGDVATLTARAIRNGSGCLEHLVEMPFQEVVLGAVDPPAGQSDDLSRLGVELLAIAEVITKPRADSKT